jgi:hypothetical protein
MTKLDVKTWDPYRATAGEIRILEVPPLQYLMVDGHGDPNTSAEYADALGALYPMAYGLKFASKNELGRDYVVPPLEGLWWADDVRTFTTARDKSAWSWTLLLLCPDWITPDLVEVVREAARSKPTVSTTAVEAVRLETLDEGLCVQTLHVGSFEDEGPVLEDLHHRFIPEHGLVMTNKHHEIYLSDVRKVAPERLRTILRQPVERVAGSS